MKLKCFLFLSLLVLNLFSAVNAQEKTLNMARPNWDSGLFRAEIYRLILEELGFKVNNDKANAASANTVYDSIHKGNIDLWFNGWFPLDSGMVKNPTVRIIPPLNTNFIYNGYLIDQGSVATYNIKNLGDLKHPEIAKLFDINNNGKADLLGCEKKWHCYQMIEHHIKAYQLEDTVEQMSNDYFKQCQLALKRLKKKQPTLIYNWDTHWFNGEAQLGQLSHWLPVPFESIPEDMDQDLHTEVNLDTCVSKPCLLGFTHDRVQPVMNRKLALKHPEIVKILELISIENEDIVYQNQRLKIFNETSYQDIQEHALEWIAQNRSSINQWIEIAKKTSQLEANYAESHRLIKMARPEWESNWFTTEVVKQLIQKLGYQFENLYTLKDDEFYIEASKGHIDLWAAGDPHDHKLYFSGKNQHRKKQLNFVGKIVKDKIIQGYLIDKTHAEQLNIQSLEDLKNPEIAKVFDRDNNGKADLIGCEEHWACYQLIEHHIKTYGLSNTVEQIHSNHSRLTHLALEHLNQNRPVLLFAWSPDWITEAFETGTKSYWLPVPFKSFPAHLEQEAKTTAYVKGCRKPNPCQLGFPVTQRQAVLNSTFAKKYPDIKKLLELIQISPEDIKEVNHKMFVQGSDNESLKQFARTWLQSNSKLANKWLQVARKYHIKRNKIPTIRPNNENKFKHLKVLVRNFEPFVIVKDEKLTGFSLDIWWEIAKHLNLSYDLIGVDSTAKLLDELLQRTADVGISGTVVNSERESMIDFSHNYLKAGLQILVPARSTSWLQNVMFILFSKTFILVLVGLFSILLTAAHFIWFIERKRNPEEFPQEYFKGLLEALWWAGAIMTGREGWGKRLVRGNAKVFTFVWMFTGYFIFIYFTASMTTLFTVKSIKKSIEFQSDLLDKKVVAVKYSDAEEFLLNFGVIPSTVDSEEKAYELVKNKQVDAFVHYSPALQYYAAHQGKQKVKLVGKPFQVKKLGFALTPDSPLRKSINKTILILIENGTYQQIYQKWFGKLHAT